MSTVHIRSEDGVAVFGAAKRHLEEYGCHHRSFYAGCSSCELRKELDKVGISIPPKEYPNHEARQKITTTIRSISSKWWIAGTTVKVW